MDWAKYFATRLRRPRVTQATITNRNLTILPRPRWRMRAEIVHERSCVIPLPGSRQALVIEWTGPERVDRLLIDL